MKIIFGSMDIIDESNILIVPIPSLSKYDVASVNMLRLDMLHPVISGNKWYKLKYNIEYARANNYKSILSFGGSYSNHLVATAAAARQNNLQAIGIVRGDYLNASSSKTLQDCTSLGMHLKFISKRDYEKKTDEDFLNELSAAFDHPFIIPEGGANELGRKGAGDIALLIPEKYDYICVSVGTATSFIGLRNALNANQKLFGFAPMKGGKYLESDIEKYTLKEKNTNWQLFDEWNFGGFGKWDQELVQFMNSFLEQNHLPLDIVYTAKMMFGVEALLQQDFFPKSAKILCIHTGGLQGNNSVKEFLSPNFTVS